MKSIQRAVWGHTRNGRGSLEKVRTKAGSVIERKWISIHKCIILTGRDVVIGVGR